MVYVSGTSCVVAEEGSALQAVSFVSRRGFSLFAFAEVVLVEFEFMLTVSVSMWLVCPSFRSARRDVHLWPVGGTHCRGSWVESICQFLCM